MLIIIILPSYINDQSILSMVNDEEQLVDIEIKTKYNQTNEISNNINIIDQKNQAYDKLNLNKTEYLIYGSIKINSSDENYRIYVVNTVLWSQLSELKNVILMYDFSSNMENLVQINLNENINNSISFSTISFLPNIFFGGSYKVNVNLNYLVLHFEYFKLFSFKEMEWNGITNYYINSTLINTISSVSTFTSLTLDIGSKLMKHYNKEGSSVNYPKLSAIQRYQRQNNNQISQYFYLFLPPFLLLQIIILNIFDVKLKEKRKFFELLSFRGMKLNSIAKEMILWNVISPILISLLIFYFCSIFLNVQITNSIFINIYLPWQLFQNIGIFWLIIKNVNEMKYDQLKSNRLNNKNISSKVKKHRIFNLIIIYYFIKGVVDIISIYPKFYIVFIGRLDNYILDFYIIILILIIKFVDNKITISLIKSVNTIKSLIYSIGLKSLRKNITTLLAISVIIFLGISGSVTSEMFTQISDYENSNLIGDIDLSISDSNSIKKFEQHIATNLTNIEEIQGYITYLSMPIEIKTENENYNNRITLFFQSELNTNACACSKFRNFSFNESLFIGKDNYNDFYDNQITINNIEVSNKNIKKLQSNFGLYYNEDHLIVSNVEYMNNMGVSYLDFLSARGFKYNIRIILKENISTPISLVEDKILNNFNIPRTKINLKNLQEGNEHPLENFALVNDESQYSLIILSIMTSLLIIYFFYSNNEFNIFLNIINVRYSIKKIQLKILLILGIQITFIIFITILLALFYAVFSTMNKGLIIDFNYINLFKTTIYYIFPYLLIMSSFILLKSFKTK